MEEKNAYSEFEEKMQNLRRIILQHAKEQDVSDERFLVELHQLTHSILTLKRIIRNGGNRNVSVHKTYVGLVSAAH